MRAKRALAALTALMICLSVTVQPVLADFDDSADMTDPVLIDPLLEEQAGPDAVSEEETVETDEAKMTVPEEVPGEAPEAVSEEISEEELPAEDSAAEEPQNAGEELKTEEPAEALQGEKLPEEETAAVSEEKEETAAMPAILAQTAPADQDAAAGMTEKTLSQDEQPAVQNAGGLRLDEINFPDQAFREYLKSFDTDLDGALSPEETAAVKNISVQGQGISSLEGIAHFTALTSLDASRNALTALDLSSNTALQTVAVNNNRLTSITLPASTGNDTLIVLNVADNALTGLDVSHMRALVNLWADNNRLTTLNLSSCPLDKGRAFSVNENYLTSITLPSSGTVDWQSQLAEQRLPADKQVGYQLKWYNDADGKQPLQPADGTIACSGQTLYIKAEAIRYTLTFSAGGEPASGGPVGDLEATYDQLVSLPDCAFVPQDSEREFAGWKLNGTLYQARQQVKNLTDVDGARLELVAQWKYKDYSGTEFNITLYDGDGRSEQFKANYGQAVSVTTGLTKDHYHLIGWSTIQGGSVWLKADKTITYDRPSQLAAALGQPAQLYAVWEKDRHTVSFSGVSPAPNRMTVEYGSTIRLPAAPHRTGYVFEGWYTDGGQLWNEGSDVVEEDMTLTARYRAARFTVKLDGNNADGGNMSEMQVTYDQVQNLPQNDYSRQWHDFAGWSFTPDGSPVVGDQADISRLSVTDGDTVTLYAVWTRQKTDVTVTVEGTQYQYQNGLGTTLSIPAPQRAGWKFLGWKDEHGSPWQESTLVTQALSLTAEFEPIRYTVVFDGAGAENADAMEATKIELTYDQQTDLPANLYTRADHKFLGWSRTPGGKVEFADQAAVSALTEKDGATVTLYAVWQAPETKPVATPPAGTGSSGTTSSAGTSGTANSQSVSNNRVEQATAAVSVPQPVTAAPEVTVHATGNVPAIAPERQEVAGTQQPTEEARDDAEKPAPQEETRDPQQDLSTEGTLENNRLQENQEKPAWVRILAFALGALVLVGGGLFGAVYALRGKKR